MAEAVAWRVTYGQVRADTDPYTAVAMVDCEQVGELVAITWPWGKTTGPHRVADCSADADRARHMAKGLVVEVSYRFALDHCQPVGRHCLPVDGPLPGVLVWSWDDKSISAWRSGSNGK